MKKTFLVALAVLALALPAFADTRDQIDLSTAVVHDAPLDVASWPVTATIKTLSMRPGQSNGLSFETSLEGDNTGLPSRWQAQAFPLDHPDKLVCNNVDHGQPGSVVTDGCIQYTVWPVVKVNGQWHTAGIIQMWYTRPSTGAPILTDFHANWVYACDRWGQELCQYIPQVGDQFGFFLSAGNARDYRDISSVRERTNVVLVNLPAGDNGDFHYSAEAPPSGPLPIPNNDTRGLFNSLVAGQPFGQQTVLNLEPTLARYCIKLTPPNAVGDRTKIGDPVSRRWTRVGFGEGTWVWVVQADVYDPGDCQINVPTPDPGPGPTPQPQPGPDLSPRVASLEAAMTLAVNQLAAINNRLAQFNADVVARFEALEARKIPVSCRASLFGFGVSCSLQ